MESIAVATLVKFVVFVFLFYGEKEEMVAKNNSYYGGQGFNSGGGTLEN